MHAGDGDDGQDEQRAAKKRVPRPTTSATAPTSSNQVDNCQLKSTGTTLNRKNLSAISANQFRRGTSPDPRLEKVPAEQQPQAQEN